MNIDVIKRRVLGAETTKVKLLLESFPNASYAFSTRLLNPNYNGFCIEVRRSSDGALQNIGFANGVLDTASLLSFVGAGDGFVRTWYDQSGNNNNAVQNTDNRQPRIVNSGIIDTNNNEPILFFDGIENHMTCPTSGVNFLSDVGTIFTVARERLSANNRAIYWIVSGSHTTNYITFRTAFVNRFRQGVNLSKNNVTMFHPSNLRLSSNILLADDTLPYVNNVLTTSSTSGWSYASVSRFLIGTQIGAGSFINSGNLNFAELIIYPTDQSANRQAIEQNINAYYNIF